MANKFQVKRTSISGRTPNTTSSGNTHFIDTGELALNLTDGKLFSSNGSASFEVGANLASLKVTGEANVSTLKVTGLANVSTLNVVGDANVAGLLRVTASSGSEGGEIFLAAPANTTLSGGITIDAYENKLRFFEQGGSARGAYIDLTACAGGAGTNLLAGGAGVDTAAQFTWTNTHTFSANVSFTGNGIGIASNTGAIYLGGISDANWKIGRNTGVVTKWKYTNNTIDIVTANSNLEGMSIGLVNSNTYFETGYLGTYIASNVTIGNTSVNATINSTSFSGTANNSTNLGGVAAASYVQNTDSRTLSGNLVISGASFTPSSNTVLLGNSTQRWVVSANTGDFSGTVTGTVANMSTSVNSALLTVGTSFIANTTGAYHTGIVNAASFTTTGFTSNTTGTYPTSNSSGSALGTTTQRWIINANTINASGLITATAGANLSSNLTISSGGIVANGSVGTAGQTLASNGSGVYWANTISSILTASATAPSSPADGNFWYKTTTDVLYQYFDDGTSNYWVDVITPVIGGTASAAAANTGYTFSGTTTGNTETEIFIGGVSNSRLSVAANTTVTYDVMISARRTDTTGFSAGFNLKGVVDNFSGTVADVGTLYENVIARDDVNYLVDVRADDTNNSLGVYVTGVAGHTIKWVATVTTVEVSQ
jgi:hypothetical protein